MKEIKSENFPIFNDIIIYHKLIILIIIYEMLHKIIFYE